MLVLMFYPGPLTPTRRLPAGEPVDLQQRAYGVGAQAPTTWPFPLWVALWAPCEWGVDLTVGQSTALSPTCGYSG